MNDLQQRGIIDLQQRFYASNQRYLKALEDIVDVLSDSMYSEARRIEKAIALIDAVREDA